jgi:hypothetical protein
VFDRLYLENTKKTWGLQMFCWFVRTDICSLLHHLLKYVCKNICRHLCKILTRAVHFGRKILFTIFKKHTKFKNRNLFCKQIVDLDEIRRGKKAKLSL